ncbi:hypothetical protein ACFXG4_17755 [Nocardia sp. NPDC059246]|uniref:hypothetical protein n=1 Tax=unclassified Nocardia TaxID=2637762 RepID=UPI0036BCD0F0
MANPTTHLRRARKLQTCSCDRRIKPGEQYLEHKEFPSGESGYADAAGHPVRLAECYRCGRESLFTEGKDKWAI